MLYRDSPAGAYLRALLAQDTDPLQIIIDFCRQHGREVFWSMRMNDTHDSGRPDLFCQWKQDHPDYLVGVKGTKLPYGCNRWSSVDYGLAPVRDKVYRILEDVATRYDVDGLELDFFRHPVPFPTADDGDPVTQEHCDQMTELMRRLRQMADAEGAGGRNDAPGHPRAGFGGLLPRHGHRPGAVARRGAGGRAHGRRILPPDAVAGMGRPRARARCSHLRRPRQPPPARWR